MYISISYFGPNSKCGIGRYAGMLMKAGSRYTNVSAIYSARQNLNYGHIDPDDDLASSNHFILDKWSLNALYKILPKLDPKNTIAHFHYPSTKPSITYLFSPLIFRILGFQVYQTWHEELSRAGWVKAFILRSATKNIFVVKEDFWERSSKYSRWVLKFFTLNYVQSAPLQILKTETIFDKKEILNSLNLKYDLDIFLVFGFIFAKRNIELLLENIDTTSEVVIIAGDCNVDPKYYKKWKKIIQNQNLQNSVKFIGFTENNELASLIAASSGIVFTNRGGIYNWNTSFLLSCYSSRPVIYLYDENNAKPEIPEFTGTSLDFGLPECSSDELRLFMDKAKKISSSEIKFFDINSIWKQVYDDHNFYVSRMKL